MSDGLDSIMSDYERRVREQRDYESRAFHEIRKALNLTPYYPEAHDNTLSHIVDLLSAKREAEHDYRKELWIAVAAGTVSAANCVSKGSAGAFANAALDEFDKRFPKDTP